MERTLSAGATDITATAATNLSAALSELTQTRDRQAHDQSNPAPAEADADAPPVDFFKTLPSQLPESLYWLSTSQGPLIGAKWRGSELQQYVQWLPGALGYGVGGVEAAEKVLGGPYLWAGELENVHSTWDYSFGGFPFSWKTQSGNQKQLQFSGSEQLYQLCKTMAVGSEAFDQLARQFAEATAMGAYKYGGLRGIIPAGVYDNKQWNSGARDCAMQLALKCKLAACAPLRELLMSTHPHRLASVKPDRYWGIGTRGDGANMLPLLLEELRGVLCEDTRLGSGHHEFDRLWPTDQLTVNPLNSFSEYHWTAPGDEQLESNSTRAATVAAATNLSAALSELTTKVNQTRETGPPLGAVVIDHAATSEWAQGADRARRVCFRMESGAASDRAALYEASSALWPPSCCLSRPCDGGTTTAAYSIYEEAAGDTRIGVMVAANSGRPAGACGNRGSVRGVHCGHSTQEEDVVSNWLVATAGPDLEAQNVLFRSTIDAAWGLCDLKSYDHRTFQGVDYVNATDARCFADAWVVEQGRVCVKTQRPKAFHPEKSAPAVLVFSAGPNAGARGSKQGSMCRTLNAMSCDASNYDFFRECVKEAVRTGLDAMVGAGCDVALVARLSCGIYAGPHRARINQEFLDLVEELLCEEVIVGRNRATYFRLVDVPMLL